MRVVDLFEIIRRPCGLGLPITKGIIEAHGGAIWVDSPENMIRKGIEW